MMDMSLCLNVIEEMYLVSKLVEPVTKVFETAMSIRQDIAFHLHSKIVGYYAKCFKT